MILTLTLLVKEALQVYNSAKYNRYRVQPLYYIFFFAA